MAYVELDASGKITAMWAQPQPDNPNYRQIADTDSRVAALQASLTARRQLTQRIAAGCQIVSTANPTTLNGTYPLDDASLGKITGIASRIALGKGLPLGSSTVSVPDIAGGLHPFPSADIENLGVALSDYVAALQNTAATLASGGSAAWPAQPVTIA